MYTHIYIYIVKVKMNEIRSCYNHMQRLLHAWPLMCFYNNTVSREIKYIEAKHVLVFVLLSNDKTKRKRQRARVKGLSDYRSHKKELKKFEKYSELHVAIKGGRKT